MMQLAALGVLFRATGAGRWEVRGETPVRIGKSNGTEHYWFPEDGATTGAGTHGAIIGNTRFTMDGGTSTPAPPHRTETWASYDGGRSYEHAWYDAPVRGTSSMLEGGAPGPGLGRGRLVTLSGGSPASRRADNRSFLLARAAFTVGASSGRLERVPLPANQTTALYAGFPFDVSRLTYRSKVVCLQGAAGVRR